MLRTFLLGSLVARLAAQPAIPVTEALAPPTPARIVAIHAAAQRDGWAPQSAAIRAVAVQAYAVDKLSAAEAWLDLYHWAALLGETEAHFIPRWVAAVNEAKVGHPNMPLRYEPRDRPLGLAVAPDAQAWLIGNAAFSRGFFSLLTPLDYAPGVLQILDDLYRRDATRFRAYANLALAIAVVYDVPPPPDWPHAQVSVDALPRKFPTPADAFAWWVKQDQLGRTHHKLARLGADELKFVVDAAAPFAELEWAQKSADVPLNSLARAYAMIRYRTDRIAKDRPFWPGRTYTLADILRDGGICVDQAYFASEAGKARGVPTLLFCGAGSDGRHAWFGFLDGNGKWQLDAGRDPGQRYVTGLARDPQTWRELSDHELQFMAERFHELPSYRASQIHAAFAAEFLAAEQFAAASAAARKAVNFERRNPDGWEALIAADQKGSRDPKLAEKDLREAALAFQRYPDLEARFVMRLSASLRARGQTSEAENEERRIARKNRDDRSDLSVAQAKDALQRAIESKPLPEQIRAYNSAVDSFGRGAGVGFYDEVVRPFVDHLVQLNQRGDALEKSVKSKK